MVIVCFMGGLGNQMFQYAFGRRLECEGYRVKYDLSWNDFYKKNKLELFSVFPNISNIELAEDSESKKMGYPRYDKMGKALRFFSLKKTFKYQRTPLDAITFFPEFLKKDNIYYAGYFQSELFFRTIHSEIREAFSFCLDDEKEKYIKNIKEQIKSSNSIAVHIRRGDYNTNELYNVCDLEYYKAACDYMKSRFGNTKFFVFSNDIDWCKNNFPDFDVVYITGNHGAISYLDMYLMSLCKGNIIANSTFSWWGAWLSGNAGENIVAPKKWFNFEYERSDIIPKSWTLI